MKSVSNANPGDNPGQDLLRRYRQARDRTRSLIAPLNSEDMVVQSMPDASPVKWHLGHTTWFFETFILTEEVPNYPVFDPSFAFLFNSYYEALGPRQPRNHRGLLTRPALSQVLAYRDHVDSHIRRLSFEALSSEAADLLELGIAHEEQHQELILMDVLHLFGRSPIAPTYDTAWRDDPRTDVGRFHLRPGGLVEIGAEPRGFAFDNERPRHREWLRPFEINDRLVTNAEWSAFIADDGYSRPELWLSDGWAVVQKEGWRAPLYWREGDGGWSEYGLQGVRPLILDRPVTHVSFFEADAYARWARARLPTEAEWEAAAQDGVLEQTFDVAWQWTASAYLPYPGFRSADSAVGEYNGKFMSGQMVLRGGSQFTPPGHSRPSYRNFFRPEQRWMRAGVRLARDLDHVKDSGDSTSWDAKFAAHVVAGFSARQKALSPKYFYDAAGSNLFEEICGTVEYYPTRVEMALLQAIAPTLASQIPKDAVLVEFGSGASEKTRILLDACPNISTYVPIDVSMAALREATLRLARDYPHLPVIAVVGDFFAGVDLPNALQGRPMVGFFPGSTIGNFEPQEARKLLKSIRILLGENAQLIVGADIVKDEATLIAAYNDAQGVTARFNKNLLYRINRELAGSIDVNNFDHDAIWNPQLSRIEMYLVSRTDQIVQAAHHTFALAKGERIHTESSHKFTVASFEALALDAGFRLEGHWVSSAPEFAVFRLRG